VNRRKEIIKITAEINEDKNMKEKSVTAKRSYLASSVNLMSLSQTDRDKGGTNYNIGNEREPSLETL